MLSFLLVNCLVIHLGELPVPSTAQVVLSNGGFEVLQSDLPVGWSSVVVHPDNHYEVSSDAHSGHHSLRLLRKIDSGELGFNRDWAPDSGKQGAMLAQTRGVLIFWYKIVQLSDDGEMQFMAIPMNGRPYEEGSAQRTICKVPREHVGDGQWHRAVLKYDYSSNPKVKWIHVAGRLNTGTGEVLVDDVEYRPKIGPLVEIGRLKIETTGEPKAEQFRVSCLATNRGDAETGRLTVSLAAPPACRVASARQPGRSDPLAVDQQRELTWELWGHRTAGEKLSVSIEGAGEPVRRTAVLKPKLKVRLIPEESLLLGVKSVRLEARIQNIGTAATRSVHWLVDLAPPDVLEIAGPLTTWRSVPVFLPGQVERPAWQVTPGRACAAAKVSIAVRSADADITTDSQEFVSLAGVEQERPEDLAWQCRGAALVFHGSPLGDGAFSILAPGDVRDYELVARVPRAGRVVVARTDGQDETIHFYGKLTAQPEKAVIVAQTVDKGGAKWTLTVTFTPGQADGLIAIRYEVQCDQDRAVRAFDGPMVWAGEGAFGTRKRGAIVPGIEWLQDGEVSSSDLDFEPANPYRLRYVPHPNELTWPIMAIVCDRLGVGLMWDPNQRFDGRRRGPQPVFASPDRFSRRNHHLMGLMLPTVREMKKRNVLLAPEPVALKAGQKWTIAASLWISGAARDSLAAMDTWTDLHGLPEPPKRPRGDWAKEIAFSMAAYLQTLYDPKADGWRYTVGGPGAFDTPPAPHSNFGFDVWMGSHLADDAEVRRRCAEMVERMFVKRNTPIGAEDLGYVMGRPDRMLAHMAGSVGTLIYSQGSDGAWRFDPDLKDQGIFKGFDYHELGQTKAAELGTCARKAYDLLSFARLTGDQRAYEAALKALKFMLRFEVPRAAQVWEVPVHSPDILAAADAVDAYLEAYQIDGNKDHLAQAVRWARAGLPFVYVWGVPEYPWMEYASIAVYGASWKKWSWIGNPVQWNGLRYAYALIKLARYDSSRPWQKVATGLTISAMVQQNADGPHKALWPDSIRVDGPGRSGWEFSPRQILKNVYALTGRDEVPSSRRVNGFVLSGVGQFKQASRVGRDLKVEIDIPSPLIGWLLVARTTRPAEVRLGDQSLQSLPDDTPMLTKPGWIYRADLGLLMVGLPGSGTHRVVIAGVELKSVELIPEVRETIRFEFNRDMQGWQPANHLADWHIKDGRLIARTTGGDPYLIRTALRVPPETVKTIIIRMRVDRGTHGQFFWATSDSPGMDERKSISFSLHPGQMHDYRLPVRNHPRWSGESITAIRLDPTDHAGANIEIESIRGE